MMPTASSTCTLRDPGKPETQVCWECSSIFRTDGRCHYHGLIADGLTGPSPLGTASGLRGGMKPGAQWQVWIDGEPRPEPPTANHQWRRRLTDYVTRRGYDVHRLTIAGQPYLQVLPREAGAQ